MTIRTAEEAELSDPSSPRDPIRPRTENANKEDTTTSPADNEQDDALDALTYLRAPSGDPLEIHGWDEVTTLGHLNAALRAMWVNERGAKVLAYKAYGEKIDDRDGLAKLRDDIKTALGLAELPTVAPPISETGKSKKDAPPFCALVKGISPEAAQELINRVSTCWQPTPYNLTTPQRFISTEKSTTLFIPFSPPPLRSSPTSEGSSSTNLTARLSPK